MNLPSLHSLGLVICMVLNTVVAQVSTRPTIDLSGEWEFKLDPLDVGRGERWYDKTVSYERRIHVPGAWNAQGVAYDSEEQLRAYEAQRLEEQKPLNQLGTLGVQRESDRLFSVYPGPGWYRKQVTIPADWKGKNTVAGLRRRPPRGRGLGERTNRQERTILTSPLFASTSPRTPRRVRPSRSRCGLTRRRRKEVDPLMGCLDTLDFLYVTWGGIHRPVTIEATEATRIGEVFVAPRLPDETAEIRVAVEGPKTRKTHSQRRDSRREWHRHRLGDGAHRE